MLRGGFRHGPELVELNQPVIRGCFSTLSWLYLHRLVIGTWCRASNSRNMLTFRPMTFW